MKTGYHSTQSKAFGSIPRSEYLGLVVGFALGLIIQGVSGVESYAFEIAGVVIGCAVGYTIDRMFYWEMDTPTECPEGAAEEQDTK